MYAEISIFLCSNEATKERVKREKNWNIDHLLAYRKRTNCFRKSVWIASRYQYTG